MSNLYIKENSIILSKDAICHIQKNREELSQNPKIPKLYLSVVGEGVDKHLEVCELGFFGKIKTWLGFGNATMEKVASFISCHLESETFGFKPWQQDLSTQLCFRDILVKYLKRHSDGETAAKVQKIYHEFFCQDQVLSKDEEIKDDATSEISNVDSEGEESVNESSLFSVSDVTSEDNDLLEECAAIFVSDDNSDGEEAVKDSSSHSASVFDDDSVEDENSEKDHPIEPGVGVTTSPISTSSLEISLDEGASVFPSTEGIDTLPSPLLDEFKHNDIIYGIEKLELEEVVRNGLKMHQRTIEYLRKQGFSDDESRVMFHLKQIDNILWKEKQEKKEFPSGWLNSNYFRNVLKINDDFHQGISKYASLPVNFNYHDLTMDQEVIGFHQVGVITFLPNGHTDLKELREIASDGQLRCKKRRKLRALRKAHQEKKHHLASINYAYHQLNSPTTIKQAIEERELALQSQMLVYLMGMVKQQKQQIQEAKPGGESLFSFIHLGLLNEKNDSLDPTGWRHNELHEREDHYTIFQDFANKSIIFDETDAPYIDLQGNVHLPKDDLDIAETKTMKLNPIYLNTTVQGHTANTGRQKEINSANIQKLKKLITTKMNIEPSDLEKICKTKNKKRRAKLLKAKKYSEDVKKGIGHYLKLLEIERRLDKGESNYGLAVELGVLCTKLEAAFSLGCLSAKDRTGVVGFAILQRFLKKHVVQNILDEKAAEEAKESFAKHLLQKKGVAVQNCTRNGWDFLKFSTVTVPEAKFSERFHYLFKKQIVLDLAPTKGEPKKAKVKNSRIVKQQDGLKSLGKNGAISA